MKAIRLTFAVVLIALLVVMGCATFIGQAHGSVYASERIYATPWFFGLWTILALLSVFVMWKARLYRRLAVCTLHVSLLIILLGAAVTWFTAEEGVMHIRQGVTENQYLSGNRVKSLPFSLRLDSFQIEYYPGTEAPSDFVSHVTLDAHKPSASLHRISMNNILQAQGYRIFQSSFDNDLQGTILTVRHDPYGTPLTYCGYALLGLSMLWVLLSRKEEFRRLLQSPALRRGLAITALLMMGAQLTTADARSIPTITKEKADKAATMQIVYNDRVAPFSTLAHDFTQKIYGKSSYKGLTAEQVVYGWLSRPDVWKDEPIIRIKDADLCRRLGIEGHYASLAQLFDGDAYRLSSPEYQPSDKAVRELDEKVGLIIMLTSDRLFHPLPDSVKPLPEAKVRAEIIYNEVPFSKILFMASLTLGFLSFFLMLYEAVSRRRIPYARHLFGVLLWAVFLFHLLGYCLRWYISGRIPLGNGYETMQFLALCILAVTLLLTSKFLKFDFIMPFGFLLSGFALLVSYLGQMNPQITHLMPVLSSPLLSAHVSIIMMSYALLAFMMLNGIYALLLSVFRRQTDIEALTILSRLMLYPAVFFLAAGIFLGAVWANVSWGRYWSWDPKEVWALITMLVYAVPLHQQSIPAFRRPKLFHTYLIIAFLTVLMTYFGVNYFLGGMHSYA
ncbi:MAG: cytochrome c biogenesis protein CcsA [Prevotella sp.]|nr:cytochrome c biogenesis protein CcsA [Prevotella sp.]